MNTMELVRFVERAHPRTDAPRTAAPLFPSQLFGPTRHAILCARQLLLSRQRDDGPWLGAQCGNAALAGQLILMLACLGRERSRLAEQAAATILDEQLPTGGWSLEPGGDVDISASVQCYFALKLAALEPGDERLSRARRAILALGGAGATDATTRFFLAMLGQIDYDRCPPAPPERLHALSRDQRWRAPLSLIWSHRPVRNVGIEPGIRELFIKKPGDWNVAPLKPHAKSRRWLPRFAHALSTRWWQQRERLGLIPFRRRALDRAETITRENTQPSRLETLNFPELLWHILALEAIGCSADTRERQACEARLHEMICIDDDCQRASPRLRATPFADTLVAIRSLRASGTPSHHPRLAAAAKWLSRSRRSDASPDADDMARLVQLLDDVANQDADLQSALPPAIEVNPDPRHCVNCVDTTTQRLNRLRSVSAALIRRLLDEQRHDGGWGAPHTTGMVLEAIASSRCQNRAAVACRAVECLRNAQRPDGSWSGTTGAIHATSHAIRGLLAAGVDDDDEAIAAAVNWLRVHQGKTGGWNDSTSDTCWALLALASPAHANQPPALRAVNFLLETQHDDGRWEDPNFVLRDAATNRCIRNDLFNVALPIEALARWAVAATAEQSSPAPAEPLRLVRALDDIL
jgi:squalene-hopene/tetraprenyl-beta-curcumene cyclase